MPAFNDSKGTSWPVTVTVGLVRKVRLATAADEGIGRTIDLAEVSGSTFIETLLKDRLAVMVVAWLLCEAQAIESNITEEQFYQRAVPAFDNVRRAIVEAAADFGKSQEERTIFLGLIDAQLNASAASLASEHATAQAVLLEATRLTPAEVQQQQTDRLQAMRQQEQKIFEAMTSSTTAGDSQPLPDSAPPTSTPTASLSDLPSSDSAPNGTEPP